jgi:acyl-CoA thioesterase-1
MVNVSEPEGTCLETLYNSIMKILTSLLLIAVLALAACKDREPESPAAKPSAPAAAPSKSVPKIVAFGDSLTAGYGLPLSDSYPAMLQKRLQAEGYTYEVVNAGVSGDTTDGGVRRIDWALEGDVKFMILELGANDILRGQPVSKMKNNLEQIIEQARQRGARVLLAGMEAPVNAGPEYRKEVHEAFQELAQIRDVEFIPFFLDRVAGVQSLNQADGVHPNAEGNRIVAETVYQALRPMLEREKAGT